MKRKPRKGVQKSLDARTVGAITITQLLAFADMNNADLSIKFVEKAEAERHE